MKYSLVWLSFVVACRELAPAPMRANPETRAADDIIDAIMMDDGSLITRTMALHAARELLVPLLSRQTSSEGKANRLRWWRDLYQMQLELTPLTAFSDMAIRVEIEDMYQDAQALAVARAHHDLWPTDVVDAEWADMIAHVCQVSPRTVIARLDGLAARYDQILDGAFTRRLRSSSRAFWVHRNVELIRNHLHVAEAGDLHLTHGVVYDLLVERGMRDTAPHPLQSPW